MSRHIRSLQTLAIPSLLALACASAPTQAATVSLRVELQSAEHAARPATPSKNAPPVSVIAWLTPLGPAAADTIAQRRSVELQQSYRLVQKNKQFSPHILVVPTGASVDFPNLDPFFHNVFSLFNGRRFDLGLYEAGSHRAVRFDREGVSYLFCNIHPEMAAVIVSLATPFYASAAKDGSLSLADVPPGDYELHLWAENVSLADLSSAGRRLHVTAADLALPPVRLLVTTQPGQLHKNKFGEDYPQHPETPY